MPARARFTPARCRGGVWRQTAALNEERPADQALAQDRLERRVIPIPAPVLKDGSIRPGRSRAAIMRSASPAESAITLSTTQSLPASRARTARSA